ncbi:MAG: hypothetical protein U0793_17780 [Gemmataceae bacterium]
MDSQPAESLQQGDVADTAAQLHAQAIHEMRKQCESLVAEIKQRVDSTAQLTEEMARIRDRAKVDAETAKTDADAKTNGMRDAVAVVNQQADAARAAVADIQTASTQTKETSAQAAGALESLRTLSNTATETVARIEALKTQVEQAAQVAAQRSEHIEDGRRYVDQKRAEIDTILTAAQQSATSAEGQHQASRGVADSMNSLFANLQGAKAVADGNADAVASLRRQCEDHATTTKRLADLALTTEERVAAYEKRLTELDQAAADRVKTIESLLPGATSAGLASAFNARREQFKLPGRIWQGIFLGSIAGLLFLTLFDFGGYARGETALTWEHVSLSLLNRLPLALPLVWLAFHAAHRAALAQRIEEDYGFKETVSRSFEGFRREMSELEGKAAPESALSRLCTEVLAVITNPPGRIYEKHHLHGTPMNAIADSAGALGVKIGK